MNDTYEICSQKWDKKLYDLLRATHIEKRNFILNDMVPDEERSMKITIEEYE